MTQWYVQDLSKLTGVSVQTLHHYDRIGLLKPSIRLDSGYRLYLEKDLLRLQQILALKSFGFGLSQIKLLLTDNIDPLEHFSGQARFLEEKAKSLLEASQALRGIVSDVKGGKTSSSKKATKLIKVLTKESEKTCPNCGSAYASCSCKSKKRRGNVD